MVKNELARFALAALLLVGLLSNTSTALRPAPDKAKIEAEARQIQSMAALGDIVGLIEMLSIGEFPSKVTAAEHLGEIGDERALPELERLNEENGGWVIGTADDDRSGAFAVAICKILTRDLTEKEQIEALFELLEGKGVAVPRSIEPYKITVNGTVREIPRRLNRNFDVGKRVATELDKFDDPSIVGRLRQSENRGAAIPAVWMEVRNMDAETAIAHCVEIARTEDGAGRYGAIHCLGKFRDDAIDALDELVSDGYAEGIRVLSYNKENPEALNLICWHLVNNKNSRVRLQAVNVFYLDGTYNRRGAIPALIKALYDPSKYIRRNASQLLSIAAYWKQTPHLDELEEAMLIALKHADEEVREYAAEALEHLGSKRIADEVPDPPPFRSDLEVGSKPPLTVQQKLEAKVKPIEEKAVNALKLGPPEEAVKLYEQLLELRPAYEPYEKALEKARAYVKAATKTTEEWYPDAPYIGTKGRYAYLLAREPNDTSSLQEEFDLASFLAGKRFEGWSNIFGDDPKAKDQYEKALKLYEHIAKYYPENEYKVIAAKMYVAGLKLNLHRDVEAYIVANIDVFAIPVGQVTDSTDKRRNRPLQQKEGKTQAQLDFERLHKNNSRDRVIQLCTRGKGRPDLLDAIIERCADTDPKIVEMAKVARAKIEQQQEIDAERARNRSEQNAR